MIRLIQLQTIDAAGKHVGGLYLNLDKIDAVMKGPTWNGRVHATIQINGQRYDLAQGVSDVLDEIAHANN